MSIHVFLPPSLPPSLFFCLFLSLSLSIPPSLFLSLLSPDLEQQEYGGSAGPFRCGKVSTWEGGFRVPAIAWYPGKIRNGRTTKVINIMQVWIIFMHWVAYMYIMWCASHVVFLYVFSWLLDMIFCQLFSTWLELQYLVIVGWMAMTLLPSSIISKM